MSLSQETTVFLIFVVMGMLFSIIFDVFRAIRKIRKGKKLSIYIQDIIYFIIIGIILTMLIVNYMNTELRVYLILAIILGIVIYISTVGNMVVNVLIKLFKLNREFIGFLLLPVSIYFNIFERPIYNFKKYIIKCCKKIKYMVNLNHIKKKFEKIKTKEDLIDGKRSE